MSGRWLLLPMLAIALGIAPAAHAQDPQVRAQLDSDAPAWVGQRMTVIVELLVPGYFASATAFDLPDPSGVLLMPPQSHPLVSSETIDGVRYTVQRHELPAWAMRSDASDIPAFTARVSFKRNPLDADGEPTTLTTSPIPIVVRTPPGAEGLGTVVSVSGLKISDDWDPQPGDSPVKAGDAFKRTVTFSAPDVPGMLFPPLPAPDIDGIGVYSDHQVRDHTERGAMQGQSVDRLTYVLEQPGEYSIPAATFTWFDLDRNALRTHTFPAQAFTVEANPDQASVPSESPMDSAGLAGFLDGLGQRARVVLVLVTGLLLLALVLVFSPRARSAIRRWLSPLRPVHLEPLNPGERKTP